MAKVKWVLRKAKWRRRGLTLLFGKQLYAPLLPEHLCAEHVLYVPSLLDKYDLYFKSLHPELTHLPAIFEVYFILNALTNQLQNVIL